MSKNGCMLKGKLVKHGYDWWYHGFYAKNSETGERTSFLIQYYIVNPQTQSEVPILGQLKKNKDKGIKPSYGRMKVAIHGKNNVEIHNYYGIKDVSWSHDKLDVKIGNNVANETMLKGKVKVTPEEAANHPEMMCGPGEVEWNLTVRKLQKFDVGYGASKLFCALNAFEMFWHVEGMKSEYSGELTVNGTKWIVEPETSFGYQDKNWGRNYTSPWVWLNCNDFTSAKTGKKLPNTSLVVGGGRPVCFGIPFSERLLMGFNYENKMYDVNFSKFWRGDKETFKCYEDGKNLYWDIKGKNRKYRLEINFKCNKAGMNNSRYETPAGKEMHKFVWNGGDAEGEVKLYMKRHVSWVLVDTCIGKNGLGEYGV